MSKRERNDHLSAKSVSNLMLKLLVLNGLRKFRTFSNIQTKIGTAHFLQNYCSITIEIKNNFHIPRKELFPIAELNGCGFEME